MIGIIDYGAGNLESVQKALTYLGVESRIVGQPDALECCRGLILPGVGNFGAAVQTLHRNGLFPEIKAWLEQDRPFLGICLGMQLLFQNSEESPAAEGFGILSGEVVWLKTPKIPHIGWNGVRVIRAGDLWDGIPNESFFYFLHSFIAQPGESEPILAQTDYYGDFPVVFNRGRIYGVQFHPEKSGRIGLRLLNNWSRLC